MRILLDECLPARLRRDLPGHDVQTVPQAGWAGIKNGRLLRLISDSGNFSVFLTMDKNLPHQQNLKDLPFAVVVLRAKSNRFEDTHPFMSEVFRRLAEFQPGQVYVLRQPD
jgi:predicted nuclease of predicted toxin-antitoxin system